MDERELNLQRTVFVLQRRLQRKTRLHRNQLRYSCMWATNEEFQQILDCLVNEGKATREEGARGGEYYRTIGGGM
jgi:hypothetical protein